MKSYRYLGLVAAPLLVFFAADYLLRISLPDLVVSSSVPLSDLAGAQERLTWSTLTLIKFILYPMTGAYAAWVIFRCLDQGRRWPLVVTGAGVSLVWVLVVVAANPSDEFAPVMMSLLQFTGQHLSAVYGSTFADLARTTGKYNLALAVPAMVFGVLGVSTIIAGSTLSIERLHDRMVLARRLLYLGSAMLTLDSLFVVNWINWAAALVGDEQVAMELADLAHGLSLFRGTAHSVVLAVVFLPLIWILERQARALARNAVDSGTPATWEQWERDHDLVLLSKRSVSPLVAVFAPVLAGPLGEVVGAL